MIKKTILNIFEIIFPVLMLLLAYWLWTASEKIPDEPRQISREELIDRYLEKNPE